MKQWRNFEKNTDRANNCFQSMINKITKFTPYEFVLTSKINNFGKA